jgi:pyocin large subunit-like protein
MRIRIFTGLASAALIGLSACDSGASAVETRDRSGEATTVAVTAASGAGAIDVARDAEPAAQKTLITANRRETVDEKIQRLYERNGADFGARSAEDFLAKVTAFTSRPPAGVETIARPNGDTLLYQASTNTFAVVARDGTPRTMFKPDEGQAYWTEQKASAPTFGRANSGG